MNFGNLHPSTLFVQRQHERIRCMGMAMVVSLSVSLFVSVCACLQQRLFADPVRSLHPLRTTLDVQKAP